MVVDIGGGSTELVIGDGPEVGFYASLQAGTVRHTERHITHDPPEAAELEELAADVRGLIDEALEGEALAQANFGIGVAGTPTSLAAIDQRLDPYDPELVHGYRLSLESIQRMLSELAAMPLAERLEVPGLHPGRAPTIVAGVVILIQVMRAFGLAEIEVSEHDILWGAALEAAALRRSSGVSRRRGPRPPRTRGEVAEGGLRAQVLVEDAEPALAPAERRVLDEAVDDRELDPADAAEHLEQLGDRLPCGRGLEGVVAGGRGAELGRPQRPRRRRRSGPSRSGPCRGRRARRRGSPRPGPTPG